MAAQQERVDGRLEERLERLERLLEAMLARPIQVNVEPEMNGSNGASGCTYIVALRLLVKLKRDLSRDLKPWPEARKLALERIAVYQAELEELLAEEPTYGK